VPQLTTEAGVIGFVRGYLGHRFASTTPQKGANLLCNRSYQFVL
jgi:hypothetical protein